MVTIVIPSFNCHEYLDSCLTFIRKNTYTKDYNVVIVDNGSNPPVDASKYDMNNIVVLRQPSNLGYTIACNIGIKYAKENSEYICVMNNDVIVTSNWLNRMLWHMEGNIGIVGPITNMISGQQAKLIGIYNNEKELSFRAEENFIANQGNKKPYHRIVGFCMLIKSEVFDKIGLFDEIFNPGNYEDDDLCLRAIKEGYKCVIAEDVFVHHFGGVTFSSININYASAIEINKKKFADKWTEEEYKKLVELNGGKNV